MQHKDFDFTFPPRLTSSSFSGGLTVGGGISGSGLSSAPINSGSGLLSSQIPKRIKGGTGLFDISKGHSEDHHHGDQAPSSHSVTALLPSGPVGGAHEYVGSGPQGSGQLYIGTGSNGGGAVGGGAYTPEKSNIYGGNNLVDNGVGFSGVIGGEQG